MVGETGFEPAAFSSRTRRATWLRYTPMNEILLHPFFARKPLLLKGRLPKREARSQLFDGTDLVFVQARTLAIKLLEFVEARVLVERRGVHCLDLAAIVQGNDGWRCAAGEGAQAQGKIAGGKRVDNVDDVVSVGKFCA